MMVLHKHRRVFSSQLPATLHGISGVFFLIREVEINFPHLLHLMPLAYNLQNPLPMGSKGWCPENVPRPDDQ
jgi:hypothetical protein